MVQEIRAHWMQWVDFMRSSVRWIGKSWLWGSFWVTKPSRNLVTWLSPWQAVLQGLRLGFYPFNWKSKNLRTSIFTTECTTTCRSFRGMLYGGCFPCLLKDYFLFGIYIRFLLLCCIVHSRWCVAQTTWSLGVCYAEKAPLAVYRTRIDCHVSRIFSLWYFHASIVLQTHTRHSHPGSCSICCNVINSNYWGSYLALLRHLITVY